MIRVVLCQLHYHVCFLSKEFSLFFSRSEFRSKPRIPFVVATISTFLRRQFFPHGSNMYSSNMYTSDIQFLVNRVSNLLSLDSSAHDQRRQLNKHVRIQSEKIDIQKASSTTSRVGKGSTMCCWELFQV